MLVMGIDTSTEIGAVGLCYGQQLLGEMNIRLQHRHSERLIPNIDFLLKESGFELGELDGLAVTIGPGSFTGLRIGLSTVKTFAQVLEIPVIGLSTLDVLAYNLMQVEGWIVPVLDARRDRVYTTLFAGGETDLHTAKRWDDQVLQVNRLVEELEKLGPEMSIHFTGNGVEKYGEEFGKLRAKGRKIFLGSGGLNQPRGSMVAELGYLYLKQGKRDSLPELLPNYLKETQAEINYQQMKAKGR